MSDAISNAINTAKKTGTAAASNAASAAVSSAADAAKAALPPAAGAAADKLKSLPVNKDPELLKKQAEAEVLSKKAQAEQLALVAKDLAIEYGKKKLIELAIKSIPFPKLPVLDPKIIQAVMLGLQAREMWKQRKSMSKDNLKKGKDAYSYPLKPKVTKPEPPEVVEIPTNNIKPKEPTEPEGTRVVAENGCTITVRTATIRRNLDGARQEAQNEALTRLRQKGCILTAATVITVTESKSVPGERPNYPLNIAEVKVEGK